MDLSPAFVFSLFWVKTKNPLLLLCILICCFLSSHSTNASPIMRVCVCVMKWMYVYAFVSAVVSYEMGPYKQSIIIINVHIYLFVEPVWRSRDYWNWFHLKCLHICHWVAWNGGYITIYMPHGEPFLKSIYITSGRVYAVCSYFHESNRRWLWCLLLCLFDVFWVLNNSFVCWSNHQWKSSLQFKTQAQSLNQQQEPCQ